MSAAFSWDSRDARNRFARPSLEKSRTYPTWVQLFRSERRVREQTVPVVRVVRVVRVVQSVRAGAVRAAPGNHVDVTARWLGRAG